MYSCSFVGSLGEVANEELLGEHFAIKTEEHVPTDDDVIENQKQVIWTEVVTSAMDQLRQRMAWALAQIVTTVPDNINAKDQTEVHLAFYDIMVRHAFGKTKQKRVAPFLAHML